LDALPHPWLQRALDHRHAGVVRLHPYAQRGRHRPLHPCAGRHPGHGDLKQNSELNEKGRPATGGLLIFTATARHSSLSNPPPSKSSLSSSSKSLSSIFAFSAVSLS